MKSEERIQLFASTCISSKRSFKTKGVLSTPNPKKGKSLPVHMKDMVKEFYYSDTVSRVMPGKKDFLSVMENGK